jgi:hypothetical protein
VTAIGTLLPWRFHDVSLSLFDTLPVFLLMADLKCRRIHELRRPGNG